MSLRKDWGVNVCDDESCSGKVKRGASRRVRATGCGW